MRLSSKSSLLLVAFTVGCVGGDKGKDDSGLDGGELCTPYETTPADDSQTGTWSDVNVGNGSNNDGIFFTFTAPSDPGGGVLRVALAASGEVVPSLIIQESGDASGAIVAGGASGTADESTKYASFAVKANHSYSLEARQGVTAATDSYPQDFTISWTFESLVDCYEPNDTAAQAQAIPLDQDIVAYAFAGYAGNSLVSTEYDDWYQVTVADAATLSAAMVTPPGDGNRMRIRIWSADGSRQLGAGGDDAGGETFAAETSVEAGTYLVSVEVGLAESAKVEDQAQEPAHFSQPYTLRVSAN